MVRRLREEFSFIHGSLAILMASWFLMEFAIPIPNTYYSLFVLELGGTPFILGVIGFASFMALALVQFPGGYLADKYGRRKLIVMMTFGVAISHVFYALAPTWHFILLGAVLGNLCLIYQPALFAMRADLLPPEKRGMGFSITRVVGILSIASPLVAGFLYANYGLVYGMRIAYFIVVAFLLLAAVLRLRLKETLKVGTEKLGLMGVIKGYPRAVKESVSVWRVVPRSAFYLFLVFSIVHFFVAMCIPYYVVYATKILGIEEVQWAILLTLESAIVFASAIPIGKLIDKFGRKKPLVVSNILFALSMPLFIYGDFTKLLILFFISAICNVMLGVSYESMQADLVAREQRGKVVGFTGFFENILMATGQLTGGFLYESISPQLPFMLLLSAMILTATLTMLLIQEPEKREA